MAGCILAACGLASAQNSDFNLSMHAHEATADSIGLPRYPGSLLHSDNKDDSDSADLGFALNSFKITIRMANYISSDDPRHVFAFYRNALARYGDVLECDHGRPVGGMERTSQGLTCKDEGGINVQVAGKNSSEDHELRAGSRQKFRVVTAEARSGGGTRFLLGYFEVPRDEKDEPK